jgi:hypothetical protein
MVLYSGASDHMVNDERLLVEVQKLEVPIKIGVAKEGQEVEATKEGNMRMYSVIGEKKYKKLKLYDVLFIKDLKTNLISVKKFEADGNKIVFANGCVTILDSKGSLIATGMRMNNLYYLDVFVHSEEGQAFIGQVDESLVLWHKRFGHMGHSSIVKMMKGGLVNGLDIHADELSGRNQFCDSCVVGKHTRKPFVNLESRSSRPLELIHSDVCGPFQCRTYDGFLYFVSLKDSAH